MVLGGTEEEKGKSTGNERSYSGTRKAGTSINKTTFKEQQAWAAVTAPPKHEL